MNDPPPRPELCGSTRPSVACTATAASTAVPPARSTFSPASTAIGLAAATMALAGVGAWDAAVSGRAQAETNAASARQRGARGTNDDLNFTAGAAPGAGET